MAVLTDPGISSQHAQVVFGGDGFYVEDLGSRNGVYVNGTRIQGRQKLAAGDFVVIGSSRMRVSFAH
ncbi:MAG: FHA domain-containing protein [Planctomycetota bacterium]